MALLHNWITRVLLCWLCCKYPKLVPWENSDSFLEKSFKRDYRRWIRRCAFAKFQVNWDRWVSQIHFLYGCAWATLLGTLFGKIWSVQKEGDFWWLIFPVVGLLSLLGAFFQDYDALYYEVKIMKENVSEDIDKLRHRRRWD